MTGYKLRLRLRGLANVYIKSSLNIDQFFYNELIFDLNSFLAFIFGDIIIIYSDSSVPTSGQVNSPLWIPPWIYTYPNICWQLGYNYNDLTLAFQATFKYPQCYKMVLTSLEDFSNWAEIITNFGNNQYLFGLLDQCFMSTDNPYITAFQWTLPSGNKGD